MAPVLPEAGPYLSPGEGTEPEGRQRDGGGADGEPGGAGEGKAQEDDIAGHVGHEDVPEHQVAEGVDQPGRHGQPQQQRGEGTVA